MFIKNLDTYLNKKGMNDAQFERLCGLGKATVLSWRRGKSPTIKTLERIADATGVAAWKWVR